MLIHLGGHAGMLNDGLRENIRLGMERTDSKNKSVEIIKGDQQGLRDLFEDTLAISWLQDANDETNRAGIILRALNRLARIVYIWSSLA
jgi:hypothetical protein